MSHVFISYSRRDTQYAKSLANKLRELDFQVWMDDRIKSSDDWWQQIHKALVECVAFIVIMTPAAEQSEWVQREVTLAANLNKVAFPILLKGDPDISKSPSWSIYVRTQFTMVQENQLPYPGFYEMLRSVVAANSPKIRFDGYYHWSESTYPGKFASVRHECRIEFKPDNTLTEFEKRIVFDSRSRFAKFLPSDFEYKQPYGFTSGVDAFKKTEWHYISEHEDLFLGEYGIKGGIITIHSTEDKRGNAIATKYRGYIDGDNLKLEVDPDREIPWHLINRRLYEFKPFYDQENEEKKVD